MNVKFGLRSGRSGRRHGGHGRGVKERMEAILERRDPGFPDILVISQEETNARS